MSSQVVGRFENVGIYWLRGSEVLYRSEQQHSKSEYVLRLHRQYRTAPERQSSVTAAILSLYLFVPSYVFSRCEGRLVLS